MVAMVTTLVKVDKRLHSILKEDFLGALASDDNCMCILAILKGCLVFYAHCKEKKGYLSSIGDHVIMKKCWVHEL